MLDLPFTAQGVYCCGVKCSQLKRLRWSTTARHCPDHKSRCHLCECEYFPIQKVWLFEKVSPQHLLSGWKRLGNLFQEKNHQYFFQNSPTCAIWLKAEEELLDLSLNFIHSLFYILRSLLSSNFHDLKPASGDSSEEFFLIFLPV